ncbi:hypothetical protein CHS0354_035894 [Potamilus streckersoni]|uniref:Mitochondrial transcription rescue factor 1 C-terminal domain-containing protein n=1 Tax=Potamilus streckersoni TaxID=2493646 RepID=A0AAE0SRV4_9BIVA|nr:hypothetical protein CHS0354_035894 [Potamilus streckersoni]
MGYQSNILKLIVQQASKFTCIFRPHVDMVLSPVAVSSVADIGHLHEQHSHAGRLPFIYTDIVSNFNESQISYLQRYRHQNKYVCKSCQISFHRKFHVLLPREIETMQKFGSARFESLVINRRYKSKSKQKKDKVVEEEDSESEEEEETDEEIDNMVFEEDYDAPMNYKQIKVNVKSLRADSILGSGLNIPRNKLDEYFYQSSLRLNSVKLLKKSKQVDEGDFLDLVVEKTDNILKVKRVRLMKILKNTTSTGRRQVIIRAWRGVFEIANPDKGKVHEEETDQSK